MFFNGNFELSYVNGWVDVWRNGWIDFKGNDILVILVYFSLYYIISFFFLGLILDFVGLFFGDLVYGEGY